MEGLVMSEKFIEIETDFIKENIFKLIRNDWMLITAGVMDDYNTMTASWGGFGVLWHKDICFCFIRPRRFTFKFMEKYDNFTLSFFDKNYRGALSFCGMKSGRDVDKTERTDLTPLEGTGGSVYFKEARMVIECKKIYYQDVIPENLLDDELKKHYPEKNYHRMYVGEIIKCLRGR